MTSNAADGNGYHRCVQVVRAARLLQGRLRQALRKEAVPTAAADKQRQVVALPATPAGTYRPFRDPQRQTLATDLQHRGPSAQTQDPCCSLCHNEAPHCSSNEPPSPAAAGYYSRVAALQELVRQFLGSTASGTDEAAAAAAPRQMLVLGAGYDTLFFTLQALLRSGNCCCFSSSPTCPRTHAPLTSQPTSQALCCSSSLCQSDPPLPFLFVPCPRSPQGQLPKGTMKWTSPW